MTESSDTVVTLVDDRSVLRLSYNREDLPHAWLSVTIGVRSGDGQIPALVALWRAFPAEAELQDSGLMGFGSQAELEERLVRVRDDWLPRFIAPALRSEMQLGAALMDQDRELLMEHETLKREQHLRDARSLFESQNYQAAIEAYVLAGADRLSAADDRRLAIARRNLGDGQAT